MHANERHTGDMQHVKTKNAENQISKSEELTVLSEGHYILFSHKDYEQEDEKART